MDVEASGTISNSTPLVLPVIRRIPEAMNQFQPGPTFNLAQPTTNNLPLVILGIESICGVLCNGAVLLLFCLRPSLLRTASDFFTINLSLVDLVFSGVVLPVVLISSLMAKSICSSDIKTATSAEVAKSCVVLFGTVAAALGTLLVSLDRGDVSLKPSKRFFTHSRAVIAIGMTWCIASLGLIIAVLPSVLLLNMDTSDSNNEGNLSRKTSSYIISGFENKTSIKYLTRKQPCCKAYPCLSSNMSSCMFQLVFEIPIFIAAIITIVIIYGRILWSVQRRSKRYMNASQKQKEETQNRKSEHHLLSNFRQCKLSICCQRREPVLDKNSNNNVQLTKDPDTAKANSAGETFDATVPRKSKRTDQASKGKTDFATVAMSVTVVLAIKRMAARKIKERKKKLRHLKKMTFMIIFTFLFCWSPYYMTKLSVVLVMHLEDQATAPTNSSDIMSILGKARCIPNWVFVWTLAIAALSCILNPALYMFSREKIRLEFVKTFFSACTSQTRSKSHGKQPCYTSCLVCWDAEDNFSDKSKTNTAGSIFSTGWQKRKTVCKNKAEQCPDHCLTSREDAHCTIGQNRETVAQEKMTQASPLRWEVIPCSNSNGFHETWEAAIDANTEQTQNDGLLLAPMQHSRAGSFSVRSVDMISCSTTTASIIAEL